MEDKARARGGPGTPVAPKSHGQDEYANSEQGWGARAQKGKAKRDELVNPLLSVN